MAEPFAMRGALLLVLLSVIACTSDNGSDAPPSTEAPGVEYRDSAGVRIVQNIGPAWQGETDAWRIDPDPVIELGHGQHRSDHLVRVRNALRLSTGDIVVHDTGRPDAPVTIYDGTTGEELRRIGRTGQGPGEFFTTDHLGVLPGDTIFINTGRSIAFFTRDGTFQREMFRGRTGMEWAVARAATGDHSRDFFQYVFPYDDESFLAIGWPTGLERATYRVDRDGGNVTRFQPDPVIRSHDYPARIVKLSLRSPIRETRRFAVCGGRIHLASSDESQYLVYSPAGALERIVRFPLAAQPIDEQTIREMVSTRRERLDELTEISHATQYGGSGYRREVWRARLEGFQDSLRFPSTFPVFETMVVDSECNVWLQDFIPPHIPAETVNWTVLDADGRMLGTVALPDDMRVFEIGAEHVLGRFFDINDHVPIVSMYRLRRGVSKSDGAGEVDGAGVMDSVH